MMIENILGFKSKVNHPFKATKLHVEFFSTRGEKMKMKCNHKLIIVLLDKENRIGYMRHWFLKEHSNKYNSMEPISLW